MITFDGIPDSTFRFLRAIAAHNDKPTFEAHRADYDEGYVATGLALVEALGPRLARISRGARYEASIGGSLLRVHRDVRFSADKSPYKDHLDLWFWHGETRSWDGPGFLLRLFADRVVLGAGKRSFERAEVEAYRSKVLAAKPGRALVDALEALKTRRKYAVAGATRKTVPRGLDAEHERAELLLHTGLWVETELPMTRALQGPRLPELCAEHYARMAPVVRWLLREVTPALAA